MSFGELGVLVFRCPYVRARFIVPSLLIVCNDIWAYVFGFFFGRTPLIRLSPKKTWEGFIGATFVTFIAGFFVSLFGQCIFLSLMRVGVQQPGYSILGTV